ncbi:MAG TPA: Crp/Fnr family transcriptional regulator [Streptosporangiaceae bacterium]|jgi:CRP-like cAMP-binding protein|nr:Crp/Fnr family transcriptional regulator [Streptosporangiaceae bacterium]
MNNEQHRFWEQLGPPDQERLVAAGRITQFGAGTTICRQGDPATHLYVVISGLIKIMTDSRDGQQAVQALRGSGDVVGELAGELTGHRTASMVAVTEVQAVVVGHEKFLAFLDRHLPAAHAYRKMITRRFSDTADSLYAQYTTNGAQRLAQLLLDLAEKYGEPAGPGPALVLALPLSQDELASLVSTSRATVTRALHDWRGRGLIQTRTRRITITDPATLRRLGGRDR